VAAVNDQGPVEALAAEGADPTLGVRIRIRSSDEISLVHSHTGVEILANAYDTTWPPVPGPWTHEPVAPALIQ
jgi:hypothetical protein